MLLHFTKMNGLGNDYIFVNALDDPSLLQDIVPYIPMLSDRHSGIGGDGVIFVMPSDKAHCQMRMFNKDGREGAMCGNGIRELAKLVWDKKIIVQNPILVETQNGVLSIDLTIDESNLMSSASVQMGQLCFNPDEVPFISPNPQTEEGIHFFEREFFGKTYKFYVGHIGSKHAVCFVYEDVNTIDFCTIGKSIEQDKTIFPDGVNVEFVNVISQNKGVMRVWERGSGHTLACGTGATFVAGVGSILGLFSTSTPIQIELERGSLYISKKQDGMMIMDGEAQLVFDGVIDLTQY